MDRPTTGPSPTGSRIRVSCGHCNSVMERRNLKSHTTRVHVGLPVVEKVSREQRTITFPVHTIKRSIEPENNNPENQAKKARTDDKNDDDITVDDLEQGDLTTVTNEDIMKELLSTKELIVRSIKCNEASKSTIDEKDENDDKFGYKLQKAKTINEIVKCYGELVYLEENQIIYCEYCVDRDKLDRINESEKIIGVINTNKIEEPINDNEKQPRSFLNLK